MAVLPALEALGRLHGFTYLAARPIHADRGLLKKFSGCLYWNPEGRLLHAAIASRSTLCLTPSAFITASRTSYFVAVPFKRFITKVIRAFYPLCLSVDGDISTKYHSDFLAKRFGFVLVILIKCEKNIPRQCLMHSVPLQGPLLAVLALS